MQSSPSLKNNTERSDPRPGINVGKTDLIPGAAECDEEWLRSERDSNERYYESGIFLVESVRNFKSMILAQGQISKIPTLRNLDSES